MSENLQQNSNVQRKNIQLQQFINQEGHNLFDESQTAQINISDPSNISQQNHVNEKKNIKGINFQANKYIGNKIKNKQQNMGQISVKQFKPNYLFLKNNDQKANSSSEMIERIRKSSFYQIQDMSSNIIREDFKNEFCSFLTKKQDSQFIKQQNFLNKTNSIKKQFLNKCENNQNQGQKFITNSDFKLEQQFKQKSRDDQVQKQLYNQIHLSKEVICYSCGGNHYSNICKADPYLVNQSSSGKIPKCFNCRKEGHSAKFCLQQKKCTNCGLTGHFSKECVSNQTIFQQRVCLNCHKKGHFTKQCKQQKRCNLCMKVGHLVKNCPKNRRKQKLSCFNCQRSDHYVKNCPEPKRCFNCGSQEHYSKACNLKNKVHSVDIITKQKKQLVQSKCSNLNFLNKMSKSQTNLWKQVNQKKNTNQNFLKKQQVKRV